MTKVNGPQCSGCPFEDRGEIFIPPDGAGDNGVMLVGDSGWVSEAAALRTIDGLTVGTPFSGPSGAYIERALKLVRKLFPDAHRSSFTITNSTWCKAPALGIMDHPEKHPDAVAATDHCSPYLDHLIYERNPKVLVPLGGVALRRLTGQTSITQCHAYMLPTRYGIPAIPAYHPSFILQGNRRMTAAFVFVIAKALAIARDGASAATRYELLLDPPLAQAVDYFMSADKYCDLVCDIETYMSPGTDEAELSKLSSEADEDEEEKKEFSWEIVRLSFSNRAGTAISMPWTEPYKELVKSLFVRHHGKIIFWNQAFDVPRLQREGCAIRDEQVVDAMWAWHFLQSDLPKGLGFAAPLMLNVEPWKHLSAGLPAQYSALDSAITMDLYLAIRKDLVAEGRWDEFNRQCTDLLPTLANMTRKGMLIDAEAQNKLFAGLIKERDDIHARIQHQIPSGVCRTKVYKRGAPKKTKPGDVWTPNAGGKGGVLAFAFNPGSSMQKKALFTALGLKVPVNWRTQKPTIQAKHLRRYASRFPVLKDILDYNERQKLITSYRWPLDAEGLIHPEFGFNPSTWRKNARNPNIQTIPKRNDLAEGFRRLFIAHPGYVLIECDSSAIEAVLVGYFGGSERYIELAKQGVHKWLAEQFAGRPVSKKEPLYDQIKRIVHMSNYMGTPQRIAEEYPEDFPTVALARKLQDFYFATDAGRDVRRFQSAMIAVASYHRYLQTPFGQRHYFFDVLMGDGKLGEDAKRAVAFMPQATASALQSRFLMALPEEIRQFARAIIHDSIVMEVPQAEADDIARVLYQTMTASVPELGGLAIGAECKIGPNLADMTTLTF